MKFDKVGLRLEIVPVDGSATAIGKIAGKFVPLESFVEVHKISIFAFIRCQVRLSLVRGSLVLLLARIIFAIFVSKKQGVHVIPISHITYDPRRTF